MGTFLANISVSCFRRVKPEKGANMLQKNMLKYCIAIIGIIMLSAGLFAQINNKYAFTQSFTVWEPIWGDYITEAMTDEGLSSPIDIGFTFPYGTDNYTQVKVSSNGWLNLGTNLTLPYYGNDLATLNIRPLVAPLWDDISLQFGAVQYNSYGIAPHRIFYVQWLAAKWNYNANNEFNFMARLHENGQIDLIYGPHIGNPANASASIGINMAPGGSGNYFSVLPGQPASAFTTTQYQNISSVIPSGTMYIFMPKTALTVNAAAVNLNGSRTPMQNVSSDYVITLGNAGTTPIYSTSGNAHLMRGQEILASVPLPNLAPGGFNTATVSWAPDTTGLMYLYAKVDLANDADSLNDVTYPFAITALPYVGNDDNTTPVPSVNLTAYPNPFKDKVSFEISQSKYQPLQLSVYNLKGQIVRELRVENIAAGSSKAVWDGKDKSGKELPNGIYFVSTGPVKSLISKVILLR